MLSRLALEQERILNPLLDRVRTADHHQLRSLTGLIRNLSRNARNKDEMCESGRPAAWVPPPLRTGHTPGLCLYCRPGASFWEAGVSGQAGTPAPWGQQGTAGAKVVAGEGGGGEPTSLTSWQPPSW